MFGLTVTIFDYMNRVSEAVAKEKYKSLSHAAASIRLEEIKSFKTSPVASRPGTPPHTRERIVKRGKNKGKPAKGHFPKAVAFDAEGNSAVIGPRFSIVGTSPKAHEFGGDYKGTVFPERPFALPALQRNTYRFAEEWRGSIKG